MSSLVNKGSTEEKIGAITILVVLVAVGLWMFFRHDMGFLDEEMIPTEDLSRRRRRDARQVNLVFVVADLVWSRPVGILLIIAGLAMTPTIFRKKA